MVYMVIVNSNYYPNPGLTDCVYSSADRVEAMEVFKERASENSKIGHNGSVYLYTIDSTGDYNLLEVDH